VNVLKIGAVVWERVILAHDMWERVIIVLSSYECTSATTLALCTALYNLVQNPETDTC